MLRAQQRVGRVLRGKWQLERLLGVGGMAAVYGALHRNGKRGAIKMLHAELSVDPQIRERFLREGRAANRVNHPGAVAVLDDDVAEDGAIFLVMEWLDGESVESRRERAGGRMDVVDVLSITDQALDVLAAAHAQGIVHRDLKPDNLFVTREGQVRVLDFGIARLREATDRSGTQTGVSMGTPAFMAPEQARALWNEVDGRTDLWALGATMFTCLTGRVVHDGRTMNEQLLSAMTKSAPPTRSIAISVPASVAQLVDRAVAFDRDARFQTAGEMQIAIRQAYEALHAAPLSTAPRLVVPDVAPTLPGVDLASPSGATGQPVMSGRTGGAPARQAPTPWLAFAIVGVALVVAIPVVGVAVATLRDRPHVPTVAADVASAGPAAPAAPAPSGSSGAASASAAVATPVDTTRSASSARPDPRKSAPTPPTSTPATKPSSPPQPPQPPGADPFERRGK